MIDVKNEDIYKVKRDDILEIYTDGASRGNPGPAAIAFIFVKDGEIIYRYSDYIGEATNNVAEYKAILTALKVARNFTRWRVKVYSDSQLVIRQINKTYRIRKEHLAELCGNIYEEIRFFDEVSFMYRRRENKFIRICDEMCSKILEKNGLTDEEDVCIN